MERREVTCCVPDPVRAWDEETMDPELFRVTVVTLESDKTRLVFTRAILQLNLVTSVSSKRSLPLSFTISKKLCLSEASCSGEGGNS